MNEVQKLNGGQIRAAQQRLKDDVQHLTENEKVIAAREEKCPEGHVCNSDCQDKKECPCVNDHEHGVESEYQAMVAEEDERLESEKKY